MKYLYNLLIFLLLTIVVQAQDSLKKIFPNDTLTLGNLKIIKVNGDEKKEWLSFLNDGDFKAIRFDYTKKKVKSMKDLETSWFDFDFGISGYMDDTKYDITRAFTNPAVGIPVSKRKMQPKNSSTNVNIWLVQQKLNLYKHKYYFKYGLGFEMFNYYYANGVEFRNNEKMYIFLTNNVYKKDKLYINYLTVPLILSRTYKFKKIQDINVAGGVNIGYLLNTRNKQISDREKKKYEGDFNFNDYKMAGVFQIGIGDVKFYGTAAITNIIDKETSNQSFYPYTFGIRFSKF
jgi:hypothetical protein